MWSISENQIDIANKEIGSVRNHYHSQLLNPPKPKEMVMDVYSHPSKYIEVIRKMMERYGSYHKGKETTV